MKRIWMALAGAGFLLGAGCPITEEIGDPEATLYGRIKADVAYDSDQTNSNGNFVQWVSNKGGGDQMAVTARETRLGVKFNMGEAITGKAEVDFYGGSVSATVTNPAPPPATITVASSPAENKPSPLLRHLFVKMDLGNGMSVLAGQTSDVFSPILPAVINYGWGWNCGNTGYRRPQFRFEYAVGDTGILTQAAVARSIGGEVSGSIDLQGRVGYTLKDDMGAKKVVVGASGVYGFTDDNRDMQVSGFAIDFHVNVGPVVVRGEYFTGMNLKSYLGGIGQGTNSGAEIETKGAWFQVGVPLLKDDEGKSKLTVNVGYLFDDPEQKDLVSAAPGSELRDENKCFFINLRSKLNAKTEAAIEYSTWTTTYWDGTTDKDYENSRIQASLIFVF